MKLTDILIFIQGPKQSNPWTTALLQLYKRSTRVKGSTTFYLFIL